jgi:tRNA pseudouridine13 synthase
MADPVDHHCPFAPLHPLPRLTADLPGCGGQLRVELDDFQVEEIPLYLPSGQGDHLYLWIEKTDIAAESLRRHVSRALGVSNRDIGMAGLKDRRAVTRQWLSVPRSAEERVSRVDTDKIRVLDVKPHRNKLRTGHLAGNRFVLRLRGVEPDALARAQAKIAVLLQSGVPNFFGSQRMGHGGSTLAAGWALTQGAQQMTRVQTPDGTTHVLHLGDRSLRRLAASALQGEVFNRTVAERLARGLFSQVLLGDVCQKPDTGGTFTTDDPAREQARLARHEVAITAPMWGPKMVRPLGESAALEQEVLAAMGLTEAQFAVLGALAEGTRRQIAIHPTEVTVQEASDDAGVPSLVLSFVLPAGSFATVFVHEMAGPIEGESTENELDDGIAADETPDAGSMAEPDTSF